jgi:dTDP-4-amino-4,6-dideoxygalactose transaminase
MIHVTQPLLPPLEEFNEYLKTIWDNKWLTNNGDFHKELELALCDFLGVKYISLFSNGTLALITALQQLRITGEVITTPFSFVATTHSLWWNNIRPVFVDIEPRFLNLDPQKIEAAITPRTTAIMPVHVYGNPCDVEAIQKIADTYRLKVIYDAAHAFNTRIKNESVLNFGDLSILSFHATKVFNTIEGGAIVCHDLKTKQQIDKLKNFGYEDEITVVAPGINAKMNELQAAFGLLQLKYIDSAISRRKEICDLYRLELRNIKGIHLLPQQEDTTIANSYFPIMINAEAYGRTRDEVYDLFKEKEIYTRRYFYPLISEFPTYRGLRSAQIDNVPVATRSSREILCLPIYPDLDLDIVKQITCLIKEFQVK